MDESLDDLFDDEPNEPSMPVRHRQGKIIEFDPVTWANTVDIGGKLFHNLTLQGAGEANLLKPNTVVGIEVVGGKSKTMYIKGRQVKPGTEDQKSAASLLNSQVIADFVNSPGGESTSSTVYTDLVTPGPEVIVPVGPSGRILVVASAQIHLGSGPVAIAKASGRFDVSFTGANVRVPNEAVDPLVGINQVDVGVSGGANITIALDGSVASQAVFSGLTPGETTVRMVYRRTAVSTNDPEFSRRVLTVIKL